ncbi:C4-dicarboxylate ABC transporter [Vibrio cholerae]|nr:C4-dicarboxylate ABC transporter [Vibrio cholerae]
MLCLSLVVMRCQPLRRALASHRNHCSCTIKLVFCSLLHVFLP